MTAPHVSARPTQQVQVSAVRDRADPCTMVILGALMLSGVDRSIESVLVDISPEWLTRAC